jgi:hypothetical protein
VNITDLLISACIEIHKFLSSRRSNGFLIIRVQAFPNAIGLVGYAIGFIESLCLVGRLVFSVEVREGVGEAVGDAMLVIESDGALESGVAEDVAVREIFGYDTGAWFVFLGDVVAFAGFLFAGGAAQVGEACCAGDRYLGRAELGVVKEKGGFCGANVLLVCSCGGRCGMDAHVSFSKVTVAL